MVHVCILNDEEKNIHLEDANIYLRIDSKSSIFFFLKLTLVRTLGETIILVICIFISKVDCFLRCMLHFNFYAIKKILF